ncbi:MAG: GNAT family N-acetyltransferase [Halococcoides sp.]
MPTTIRPASREDATALDVLRRQALESTLTDHYERSAVADLVATPDRDLADRIAADDWRVLVAATDAAQAGYAVFDADRARITDIYVAPHRQREGLGSALLDRLLAADTPATAVAPDPVADFFVSNGFQKVEVTTWHGLAAVELRR